MSNETTHTHITLARLAPEVLGKVGEAFATSLFALQQRLAALGQPQPSQRDEFGAALASVGRLERLGVQVQEIARVLAGDGLATPEAIDLSAAAREAVREWQPTARRRASRLEGPGPHSEPIEIDVVAGVLEQLLDLAIDHATRLGTAVVLDVAMQGLPARPMLTLRVHRGDRAGADGVDEVHWLLCSVLARACGLAPHRVAAGDTVTLMLGFAGRDDAAEAAQRSAAELPRTSFATGRQVLLLEPRELPRLHAHRLLHDAGMQVDAVASLEQARAALRNRTPDVLVTGLADDEPACSALIDELRATQPRLRVIELVDDDNAFALSLPGAGHAGRVGRADLARTLVSAVSQELDAAWAGLAR
jgi:CheY-like chemotaxis protein